MKPHDILELVKKAIREWYADNTFQLGAALAYYSVFSLAPVLIIAIAVAGSVFGEEAARGHITGQIRDTVGTRFAGAIEETLQHASETNSGLLATLLSIGILLFTATAVFSQLQQALNTV